MAESPNITFVEGRDDRAIQTDLQTLKKYAYSIDNDVWFAPGGGFHNATLGSIQALPVLSMPDGSTTGGQWSLYLPEAWVGSNAHFLAFLSEASADAGNFRIDFTARNVATFSGTDLSGAGTLVLSSNQFTTAAGATNTPLAVQSSTFEVVGRYISLRFNRVGADAADTATVALIFWGALLVRE